jgi:hypothetical protein
VTVSTSLTTIDSGVVRHVGCLKVVVSVVFMVSV